MNIRRQGGRPVAVFAVAFALGLSVSACDSSVPKQAAPPSRSSVTKPVLAEAAVLSHPVPGPPTEPLSAVPVELPPDYVEQEFFASGTASAFMATMPKDGRWTISPTTKAAYKTRILVRRPTAQQRFNGTVVIEWMNETSGESAPDWSYLTPLLTTNGYAYVAVSAQAIAIGGGSNVNGATATGLAQSEPKRYGSLHHPGDKYSFDLFGQIARALRLKTNRAVLGGLQPKRIVAVGESQSAAYLTTFANALQPEDRVFDGIFIHSRGGGTAPLDGSSAAAGGSRSGQRIRTDQVEPVFQFETETDASLLGFDSARQPDTDRIRTWEVAGTSHVDAYLVGGYASQLGCVPPINDGPQHDVIQAAFVAFAEWVASRKPPPTAKPLELTTPASGKLARDGNGNALGGVRTPAVDVPVAALSGEPAPNLTNASCLLLGSTKVYPASKLAQLYPSRSAYLSKFGRSLDDAIEGGFLLAASRSDLLRKASAVRFR